MLTVKNLSFRYKNKNILESINFKVQAGAHISIIGESGSGKSTLLKLIYGTYDLNEGQIFWKDQEILGPKHNLIIGPDYMKYVAQEFDLMPFTTVAENIGAFLSNFYPEEKEQRTNELLKVVELESYAHIKVKELSGGQKQRVALARAIAKQPEIILLDEPFSHIDNFKKQSLRRSLFKYLKEKNITTVVATHDKDDVLAHANTMLVLKDAKIAASGTPKTLYNNPKDQLIAAFFEEFNIINHKIVYANKIKIVKKSNLKAVVKQSYYKGSLYLIEANLNGETIFFNHFNELKNKTEIYLEIEK